MFEQVKPRNCWKQEKENLLGIPLLNPVKQQLKGVLPGFTMAISVKVQIELRPYVVVG